MATNDLERVQRVVLGTLLEHRRTMLTVTELHALLPHHAAADLEVALTLLLNSGLVTHFGDKYGVSHAAVRFDQLAPI